jgi:hypothetical protein
MVYYAPLVSGLDSLSLFFFFSFEHHHHICCFARHAQTCEFFQFLHSALFQIFFIIEDHFAYSRGRIAFLFFTLTPSVGAILVRVHS